MSVKNQSYDDIEHIIVDGASNDGTLSLLSSMRSNFSALVSEPDKGIYDAMNKGIQLAKGDVIGFLNSCLKSTLRAQSIQIGNQTIY